MKEPLVRAEHIYFAYGQEMALEDVCLDIRERDFLGIIGPNGGGKTSLLKVILGHLRPLRGKLMIRKDIKKSHIGYLPQYSTFDHQFPISVEEVVASGLISAGSIFKKPDQRQKKQLDNTLEMMHIGSLKNRMLSQLSGGQMQRVFLARAIVSSPPLLILDEPDTYVDNTFEKDLYETLRLLNKDMAIVIVSHDVGTISAYIKTIACINRKLHYHPSNIISPEQLKAYNCPIQLITHGDIPHTVLRKHD